MDNGAVFQEYTELARRIKAGDNSAFAEMYQKSARLVYGTCYGVLRNEEDAADAMQDTYITCYQKIGTLTDDRMFLGWLKRIAASKSIDLYRKNHGDLSYDDSIGSEESSYDADLEDLPDTLILRESDREIFREILKNSLSEVQYQTILLYYFSELPVEAIAEIMHCPVGTVKTRLMNARVKIKAGVEMYENKSGDKIKVAMTMPFLTRFFVEEANRLTIPMIDPMSIISSGAAGGAAAGKASAGKAAIENGASAGKAAAGKTAASGKTAAAGKTAGKAAGKSASFFSTTVGKVVICLWIGVFLLTGSIVVKLMMDRNQNKKDEPEKNGNGKISAMMTDEGDGKNDTSDMKSASVTSDESSTPADPSASTSEEPGSSAETEVTSDPTAAPDPTESEEPVEYVSLKEICSGKRVIMDKYRQNDIWNPDSNISSVNIPWGVYIFPECEITVTGWEDNPLYGQITDNQMEKIPEYSVKYPVKDTGDGYVFKCSICFADSIGDDGTSQSGMKYTLLSEEWSDPNESNPHAFYTYEREDGKIYKIGYVLSPSGNFPYDENHNVAMAVMTNVYVYVSYEDAGDLYDAFIGPALDGTINQKQYNLPNCYKVKPGRDGLIVDGGPYSDFRRNYPAEGHWIDKKDHIPELYVVQNEYVSDPFDHTVEVFFDVPVTLIDKTKE
ncbi:MAG: RNA polymerase sigma factor [Clostridiales bacterium]|nr:RNA polymerase sigma factor [Clostridiales bacterium]